MSSDERFELFEQPVFRGAGGLRQMPRMTIQALASWLMTAMVAWNPPGQHREGEAAARERYASIAFDMAEAALDPAEKPLFDGPTGRAQTALLMASVASVESGFRRDVDTGALKGDHGRSYCIFQVQVRGRTAEMWTGEELVRDRKRCVRAGLHKMQESFTTCRALPVTDRLALYTTGRCSHEPGAEWRVKRAMGWWKAHPLPATET